MSETASTSCPKFCNLPAYLSSLHLTFPAPLWIEYSAQFSTSQNLFVEICPQSPSVPVFQSQSARGALLTAPCSWGKGHLPILSHWKLREVHWSAECRDQLLMTLPPSDDTISANN